MEPESCKLSDRFLPHEVFRIDMTLDESRAISLLLPLNYSIQVDPKRKDKLQVKKKTPDQLLLASIDPQIKSMIQNPSTALQKKPSQKVQQVSEALKPCLKTLEQLKLHKCAWPFLEPVDVDALNIPHYRQIIKEPMDFSTIESKLKGGVYKTPAQFHADVIKIFNNSYTFNEGTEDFIKVTLELERYYYKVSGEPRTMPEKSLKMISQPSKSQKKKKKPSSSHHPNDSQPITTEEKRELAAQIHKLAKEHIKGVRNIVFDNNSEENEFNLETISQKKLKELQKFIRSKIIEMENEMQNSISQKNQQQNLDELQSQITEEFIFDDDFVEELNVRQKQVEKERKKEEQKKIVIPKGQQNEGSLKQADQEIKQEITPKIQNKEINEVVATLIENREALENQTEIKNHE